MVFVLAKIEGFMDVSWDVLGFLGEHDGHVFP